MGFLLVDSARLQKMFKKNDHTAIGAFIDSSYSSFQFFERDVFLSC